MKPIAWITGAASGIGEAVAKEMFARGYQLILSDCNQTALKQVASSTQADIFVFDVRKRSQNLKAGTKIKEKYGYVDVVFLNAGKYEAVDVKNFDSMIVEEIIQTNFLSMIYGVEAALPLLRASKQPHLVGMSSAMSNICLPRAEAYGASKAAVRSFFQGLRIELAKEKIAVSTILPTFIKTPLTEKLKIPQFFLYNTTKAAKKILNGIERKKAEIKIPPLLVNVTNLLKYLPDKFILFLINQLS
ncbi:MULTISPECIES: SDR family NAD(P)-dependent oxidoreductase [Legionella]|uniref:SDR family NAD(P)-dependent oxidoreductase n=1 Tax=Legionella resiliens TaxID=2905958 RepID=A0ABS8X5D1_9GAMM|nr:MULTISPECIES: SDR family NAD(P)-dependent oxidoreductase [unclassified Legionella]MCE0724832.1 SDR family NAD(P)-dependent oxidoreductase [Legionella sp. 9fVS26]MCE3533986.1 SDR family NAD(P)-dependent oxidoreductase [Legionella sp. 8cVS16]QLZ70221.1 SDR family oxidoreductase [Legionella sp. PC1000]